MNIKEIVTYLAGEPVIVEKDYPEDFTEEIYEESYSSEDNFIDIKIGENIFTLSFNFYASWRVVNSGGDGYITPNYDDAEDIEVEIDLTHIQDWDNGIEVELNDSESVREIENWISSYVY